MSFERQLSLKSARGGLEMRLKTIAIIVLVVLCLIILAQNTAVTTVRLLFWSFPMSQIILVLFMLVAGFLTGYFVATMRRQY